VQQSTGVRFEGRREVEANFAGRSEVLVSHDVGMKVR